MNSEANEQHPDPAPPQATTRCGTVVLLGDPNAGKSTLLNALVDEPIAIVSPKPQTTWVPVFGIRTEGACQTVFVDPPGVMDPTEPIHEAMLDSVIDVLRSAAAALYLVPPGMEPESLADYLPGGFVPRCPVKTIRTKSDLGRGKPEEGELAVSSRTGDGIAELLSWCEAQLPEADFRYDSGDVGTQPLRFFAAEFLREAVFTTLEQELPYSVAVKVEEFREHSDPVYIRLTAFVERDSQKGIFIGKGGATIKKIGTAARKRMEGLLGTRVFLDVRVKVRPRWRKDAGALKQFGYSVTDKKRKKR